jgi:hypothetical protein
MINSLPVTPPPSLQNVISITLLLTAGPIKIVTISTLLYSSHYPPPPQITERNRNAQPHYSTFQEVNVATFQPILP